MFVFYTAGEKTAKDVEKHSTSRNGEPVNVAHARVAAEFLQISGNGYCSSGDPAVPFSETEKHSTDPEKKKDQKHFNGNMDLLGLTAPRVDEEPQNHQGVDDWREEEKKQGERFSDFSHDKTLLSEYFKYTI